VGVDSVVRPLGVIAAAEPGVDELSLALAGTSRFLLPIGGEPLVLRALRALRAAGCEEILVLSSRRSDGDVRAALHTPGAHVAFAVADPTRGVGGVIAAAEEAAAGRPVLVHAGDGFLTGPLPVALDGADVVGAGRPDMPTLLLSTTAVAAAATLGAADLPALADGLEAAGLDVRRRRAVAGWRYTPDVDALLEGNRLALDELPGGAPEGRLEAARIEGRVRIHPSALVVRTRVRGPACIGANAVLTDAFVGPYTTIGERVELDGAEVEHSLVLAGASVRHLDRRLEESIVGRDATVGRQFSLPASMRLRVGIGAEVSLA
jgi:glucose-1-phosphate thymidylyltransferase